MGGFISKLLNKVNDSKSSNAPLAADGKTQTADTPGKLGKPKRRRAGASVDTILNDRLGGDR